MQIKTIVALSTFVLSITSGVASAATLTFPINGFLGTGAPLTVTGSDGNQITFSGDASTQFQGVQQSGTIGQFSSGSSFLSAGLGDQGPITISFANPVTSFRLPAGLQQNFDYTIGLQVFDGANLVQTFAPVSVASVANGYAPATQFDFTGEATSAVLAITTASPFGNPVIGAFSYNVSSVPLPASAPMFGAAVAALGVVGYGLKRKKAAATA